MGVPKKEMFDINTLVDEILTGNYKTYKRVIESNTLLDSILDELGNKIGHIPNQDVPELQDTVEDEISKDSISLKKEDIEFFKENTSIEEWKEIAGLVNEKCKKHTKETKRECLEFAAKQEIQLRVSSLKEGKSLEDMIVEAAYSILSEDDYRTFFKQMMKSWNIDSIEDLSDEKKKKFFNAVDKAWKAKKE